VEEVAVLTLLTVLLVDQVAEAKNPMALVTLEILPQ
tara:strand:+ start:328 stop:435 length:108 start_codon:yes stop_codon:yes gene_type:complete